MSDTSTLTITPKPNQSIGPVVATGLAASACSGAVVTLVVGFVLWKYNVDLNQPNYASYVGAIHTIVETSITGLAMMGHLLVRKYLSA